MPTPAPRSWIYFIPTNALSQSGAPDVSNAANLSTYRVDSSTVLRGESVADFKLGDEIRRVCSNDPLPGCERFLAGCTQHLNYTTDAQRERLAAISAKEIPAAENPFAVLIPIRKSEAWWCKAQNARTEFFHATPTTRGHTAIGEEYAALIYRQLMHSRYLDSSKRPYDFLTYFEFKELDRDWFKWLLIRLRDEALNPEWSYVEMEQEIWMRKIR